MRRGACEPGFMSRLSSTLRVLSLLLAILISPSAHPGAPAETHTDARWLPPVGTAVNPTARFDLSNGPYGAGHRGIDLPAAAGDRVRAPTGGTVTFSGMVVDREVLTLRVDARTLISMEPMRSEVEVGDNVTAGMVIGEVTQGGHCGRECLHLGVRVDGQYVNPLRYFRSKPVLLPW